MMQPAGNKSTGKTRKQQRDEATGRVLRSSLRLFLEDGYENTTIRQIAQKSGVQIGSIYNVFDSKDEIAAALVLRSYEAMISIGSDKFSDDPLLSMVAVPMAMELVLADSDIRAARILEVAYSSPAILARMTDAQTDRMVTHMESLGMKTNRDAVRRRLFAVNGAIGGMISRRCVESGGGCKDDLTVGLTVYCSVFGIICLDTPGIVNMALEAAGSGTDVIRILEWSVGSL